MSTFRCPTCSASYNAKQDLSGRNVKCKQCRNVFRVPSEPTENSTKSSSLATTSGSAPVPPVTPPVTPPIAPPVTPSVGSSESPSTTFAQRADVQPVRVVEATVVEPAIVLASLVDEIIHSSSGAQPPRPVGSQGPTAAKGKSGKGKTGHKIVNAIFIGQALIGLVMLVNIGLLFNRLPQKIQNWGEVDRQAERDRWPQPGNAYRPRNQRNNDAFLSRHPELFGLGMLGVGAILMVRGVWGLRSGWIMGKFGYVMRGDDAIVFSKMMMVFGGFLFLGGFGYIWHWLSI